MVRRVRYESQCYHTGSTFVLTGLLSGSDVIHVDVMGSHIVILNSTKAGHELLEKRSAIYSDRYGLGGGGMAQLYHLLI